LSFFSLVSFAQSTLDLGIRYFENKEYEKAIMTLETYLKSNPVSYEAYSYLYRSYIFLNRNDDAARVLGNAIDYFPESKEFLLALAQIEIGRRNYAKCEKLLEKVVAQTPLDTATAHLVGIIYFNLGVESAKNKKSKDAIEYFKNSIKFKPDDENAYVNLSILLTESNKYQDAQRYLKEAVKKFPENVTIKKLLAEVSIELKDYKNAQQIYEDMFKIRKDDVELGLRLALLYRYNGKVPEALALYDYLITNNPRNKKVYDALIEYWKLFNKQDKIREVYEKMRAAFPNDEQITWNIAKTYEKEQKWEQARSEYLKIVFLDSINLDARLAIARTYRKEKKDSLALLELKKLLAINTYNYEALKQIGDIYLEWQNYDMALETYKKMREVYDQLSYPYLQIGRTFFALGMNDSALYYLDKAKELDQGNMEISYVLAQVYRSAGAKEKMVKCYRETLRKAIKELEKLQLKFKNEMAGNSNKLEIEKLEEYSGVKEEINRVENILLNTLRSLKTSLTTMEYINLLENNLKEYPNSVFLLLERAEAHETMNEEDQALNIYKKIMFINPALSQVHKAVAKIYERKNDLDNALLSYRRLLSLNDTSEIAYDGIIRIYEKRNQLETLCDEWQALLKTQPGNNHLRERLIEILHKLNRLEEARRLAETKKQ